MKNTILVLIGIIILIVAGILIWQNGLPGQNSQDYLTNADLLDQEAVYEVEASDASYFGEARGYFAHPVVTGSYPGVVMIHEWWGLNDNIKDMARQLAAQGYNVLAVDLYNGQVAETPDQARALTGSIEQDRANANSQAAVAYLREQNSSKVASLGWCFGGGQSLQLALSGEKLDATIIYYGQLVAEPARLAAIDWPVLGIFGDADTSIPFENVQNFEAALSSLNIPNEIYIYPGVGHAFANPSGANYAPDETIDAWEKTLSFLKQTLR